MLKQLHLRHVGPSDELRAEFGPRLNVLVGDNSFGKTFLLDVAWWVLTRTWASRPAAPVLKKSSKPSIAFTFDTTTKTTEKISFYDRELQQWPRDRGRPPNPGLVVYARVDGGFSVWDPAQNYWRTKAGIENPELPAAFHFTAEQVWGGLPRDTEGKTYCRGLIEDWASWQRENGDAFRQFSAVLRDLSPDGESLKPGPLTRIPEDADRRDIPTLVVPYGSPVPIVYASAAVKRVLALAYLLVWTWTEHQQMSELRGLELARQVIFLIDEIEAHLHPRWQRTIVRALLDVVGEMHAGTAVQIITVTHSPLVLASLEPYFDPDIDRLLHLELRDDRVHLDELPWAKEGDASAWLVSEAWMRGEKDALPHGITPDPTLYPPEPTVPARSVRRPARR